MRCNHKDDKGDYTFEKEDNRCSTDRGTEGRINYFCTKCDEDITDEVCNAVTVLKGRKFFLDDIEVSEEEYEHEKEEDCG